MQSLDKFRTPNTNKSLGIEIECVIRGRYDEEIKRPTPYTYEGFFFVGKDGSISTNWRENETSYEFVSQPLPAMWLKKEIDKLYRKYSWQENETCGVHVHVSRKWLSEAKAKVIYAFMQTLSQDDRVRFFGRSSNTFCVTDIRLGGSRYCAINTQNTNTIEFRVFKSGDAAWCKYCVDMVCYLIAQAYTLNLDAMYAFRDQYKL